MNFILVGVGGVLGGLCRFQFGKIISQHVRVRFPVGTLLINVSGAFLLGILMGLEPGNRAYLFIGDGFCGAFTTFSTFMYEGFALFQENRRRNAFLYLIGTVLLGILVYVCGFAITKRFLLF